MSQVADAILHTIDQTGLAPAGPVLILMPPDAKLSARFPEAAIWHPLADQVSQWPDRQHPILTDLDDARDFKSVIVFCPRQKDETLYLLARGLELLQAGGTLIAACDNQSGGQSLPKLFQSLIAESNNLSKHKCRVIWTTSPQTVVPPAVASVLASGSPHPRADGFISQPGLFSWSRTDKGTDALLHHLPFSFSGTGADFGCGIGILGQRLLQRHSSINRLYCIDADSRAIACCRKNLEQWQDRCEFIWADIRRLPHLPQLDFVVMNPPFHEGRADANLLGQNFITTAAAHLKPGGMLAMVANVHLPYEALLHQHFSLHRLVSEQGGFKIFEAIK
jgi:16S rRNA (guanine1207-N2)-methyltransferase